MNSQKITCGYCNKLFAEPNVAGCADCPHSSACKKIKCPYCGYDNPPISELLKWLEKLKKVFLREKDCK